MKLTRYSLRSLILEEFTKLTTEDCGCAAAKSIEHMCPGCVEADVSPAKDDSSIIVDEFDMVNPVDVANELKSAGAGPSDILNWVHDLLMAAIEEDRSVEDDQCDNPDWNLACVSDDDDFSFTGDVGELESDDAFGVGYEAGRRGL